MSLLLNKDKSEYKIGLNVILPEAVHTYGGVTHCQKSTLRALLFLCIETVKKKVE